MATTTVKNRRVRNARSTSAAAHPVAVQRKINRDYGILFQDYGRLALALWRRPATKYILGGAALATLLPFAIRSIGGFSEVNTFVIDNVNGIKRRVDEVLHSDSLDTAQ